MDINLQRILITAVAAIIATSLLIMRIFKRFNEEGI
jgi:hypothetical protein